MEEYNGKKAEETKIDLNIVLNPSGQDNFLYLGALQGHSGRNLADPSLQDNVLIPTRFLRVHLSHRMCNQYLHSIMNSGWVPGGQIFEQKTDDILHVCGSNDQGT